MIAVDTNVVVRLITQDDEQQYNKSLNLFQEQDISSIQIFWSFRRR